MPEKSNTKSLIEAAISRVQKGRPGRISITRKMSIKAVAEEAGVSNAVIHNRYPELADKIRQLINSNTGNQISSRRLEQQKLLERIKMLRAKIMQLEENLAKALSINLRLQQENRQLYQRLSLKD